MLGKGRLTLVAFASMVVLTGVNGTAIHFSNVELPPFYGGAVRFGGASLLFFLIVAIFRLPLPRGRALLGAAIFGLLAQGASFALIYWALLTVQPGMAQVIIALVPLCTLFFALIHRQESFRWRALAGSVLAFTGVLVVFADKVGSGATLPGLLALVGAAACMAEGGVVLKGFPGSHPVTTNAVATGLAAAMLLALSFLARETLVLPTLAATWAAVFYLVVPGSLGTFALYVYVLKRWSASRTSYQLVLLPFVAVIASSLLAGEAITTTFLVGGALVLLGVYVGALTRPAPPVRVVHHMAPPLDKAA